MEPVSNLALIIHSFNQLIKKNLINTYYVASTKISIRDTRINKAASFLEEPMCLSTQQIA